MNQHPDYIEVDGDFIKRDGIEHVLLCCCRRWFLPTRWVLSVYYHDGSEFEWVFTTQQEAENNRDAIKARISRS